MHFRVMFHHLNLFTRGLTFGVNKDHLQLLEQVLLVLLVLHVLLVLLVPKWSLKQLLEQVTLRFIRGGGLNSVEEVSTLSRLEIETDTKDVSKKSWKD